MFLSLYVCEFNLPESEARSPYQTYLFSQKYACQVPKIQVYAATAYLARILARQVVHSSVEIFSLL